MDYGKRIIELRNARGITQYRLAKLSGVAQQVLSKYELGKSEPGASQIEKICVGLGITVAEFYADDTEVSSERPDYGIVVIERARRDMSDKDRDRMMRMLKAAFEEYFKDEKE